jgi:hypothetical protein
MGLGWKNHEVLEIVRHSSCFHLCKKRTFAVLQYYPHRQFHGFAGRKWQIVPAQEQRMSGGQFPQQGRQKKSPNMIASPLIFGPSIPQFHSHPFWSSTAISETSRSGRPHSGIVLRLTKKGYQPWGMPRPETLERKARRCKEVSKEVVGIHVLLTRSIFACDILRRLLRRVSPVQSTSAPLRC